SAAPWSGIRRRATLFCARPVAQPRRWMESRSSMASATRQTTPISRTRILSRGEEFRRRSFPPDPAALLGCGEFGEVAAQEVANGRNDAVLILGREVRVH